MPRRRRPPRAACVDRVEKLRNDEMQRPFEHYAEDFFVDDLGLCALNVPPS